MATNFRVGQRVRLSSSPRVRPEFRGLEATYMGPNPGPYMDDCFIRIDGHKSDMPDGLFSAMSCELRPLTDPGFDAFMQSVLKPVNVDQPEKVRA